MADGTVQDDLKTVLGPLSALCAVTPVHAPGYDELMKRYRELSDLAERQVVSAIDKADGDYIAFTEAMGEAMGVIDEAMKRIENVSKVIATVAKVIDAAGKLVSRA